MPVIDYRCRSCQHVDSTFKPVSQCGVDHPETEKSRCTLCRKTSDRIYDYNQQGTSVGFKIPPVVHFNRKTGQYSIPGHRDDPVDRGYERIEIRDMRQYAKLTKAVDSFELEKAQFLQTCEREYFDQSLKSRRDDTRQAMERAISKGGHWVQETDSKGITRTRWAPITPRARQLFEIACKNSDKRREEIRRKHQSSTPNFHSRMLEFRESERSVVDGIAKRPEYPNIKELMEQYARGNGRRK